MSTIEHLTENDETPALAINGLAKKYGQLTVLANASLELPSGALIGLLGPNGAGKSTLMKLVSGLIMPDSGTITVAGYDLQKQEVLARGNLAYVPDVPSLYSELTVFEHLELVARAHGSLHTFRSDAEMLLTRFGLWTARDQPTFALSRGMTQKLALCAALVRPSRVLLLDEPASTLDIASVEELNSILDDYRRFGGLAMISSHQWESLQDRCDAFVLLGDGRLAAGSLYDLIHGGHLPSDATLRDVYMAFVHGEIKHTGRPRIMRMVRDEA